MITTNLINDLNSLIETMETERDKYIGRVKQLDDDIARMYVFKVSLQKEGDTNENND